MVDFKQLFNLKKLIKEIDSINIDEINQYYEELIKNL